MRMYLKRYKPKNSKKRKIKTAIIIFIVILMIVSIFIAKIGKSLNKYYIDYSKREALEIIDSTLNKSVNNKVLKRMKNKKIYTITRNNKGEIETIDYNSYYINKVLSSISNNVYNEIKKQERGYKDSSFKIPLFSVTNNPLLSDKGPKVPVRMKAVGSNIASIKTKVTNCGINSTLIELSVHLEVTEKVILPISSSIIKVKNDIPISYKIVKGKVPTYYGGFDKSLGYLKMPME